MHATATSSFPLHIIAPTAAPNATPSQESINSFRRATIEWRLHKYECPAVRLDSRALWFTVTGVRFDPRLDAAVAPGRRRRGDASVDTEEEEDDAVRDPACSAARYFFDLFYRAAPSPEEEYLYGADTRTWDAAIANAYELELQSNPRYTAGRRAALLAEYNRYKSRRLIILTLATLGRMIEGTGPMAQFIELLFPRLASGTRATSASRVPASALAGAAVLNAPLLDAAGDSDDDNAAAADATAIDGLDDDALRWSCDKSFQTREFAKRLRMDRILPVQLIPIVFLATQNIFNTLGDMTFRRLSNLLNSPTDVAVGITNAIRRRIDALETRSTNAIVHDSYEVDPRERAGIALLRPLADIVLPDIAHLILRSYEPVGCGYTHGSYGEYRKILIRLRILEDHAAAELARRDQLATGTRDVMQALLAAAADDDDDGDRTRAPASVAKTEGNASAAPGNPKKRKRRAGALESDPTEDDIASGAISPEQERLLVAGICGRLRRLENAFRLPTPQW